MGPWQEAIASSIIEDDEAHQTIRFNLREIAADIWEQEL